MEAANDTAQSALRFNNDGVLLLATGQASQALQCFEKAMELLQTSQSLDSSMGQQTCGKEQSHSDGQQQHLGSSTAHPTASTMQTCSFRFDITPLTVPELNNEEQNYYVYEKACLISCMAGEDQNPYPSANIGIHCALCSAVVFNLALAYHRIARTGGVRELYFQALRFYEDSLKLISLVPTLAFSDVIKISVASWNNISEILFQTQQDVKASQSAFSNAQKIMESCNIPLFDTDTQRNLYINALVLFSPGVPSAPCA